MTAPAAQRVRHHRRVTGRRAVIGSVAARFGKPALGDGSRAEGHDPIFEPADGAVLRNVIVGGPGADGVPCIGPGADPDRYRHGRNHQQVLAIRHHVQVSQDPTIAEYHP
ncbi:pectate lyase [Streptomyces europaeiscabiei]|uniref:pectate lyase n=1 Tax=Streptomyces europaeiscabiei TaxID=146819 RepID=UPI000E69FDA3|nr:pectate lyase [Streptomyces europaeiscabiei]